MVRSLARPAVIVTALCLTLLVLRPRGEAAAPAPVSSSSGMVVSSEPLATRIGVEVLKRGGNAIDAAVAVGFALAVTYPNAGNLGGGGFMVTSLKDGSAYALDYRETAPAGASRDMYLDADGNPVPGRSATGHLAVGVPGTVAGLALAAEKWGTRPLKELVKPARDLAEQGFVVPRWLTDELATYQKRLIAFPGTAETFYPGGHPPEAGSLFKQKDLADTLGQIADKGPRGFYEGEVARRIEDEMRRGGGILTAADLAAYQPVIREVVKGTWRGLEVISMPPPSSGGVHLIQMLNMLEPFSLNMYGHNSAQSIHVMSEAMKRAYADRSLYLGDPDFVQVPVADLVDKGYADYLRSTFNLYRATPSSSVKPGDPRRRGPVGPGYVMPQYLPEGVHTTHFSVVDKFGNAVSNTYTLNFFYGSGVLARGTGVLLNNEMDDFSIKPGVPNAYGLLGGDANAIAPHKRPLSSMSPTIVRKDGKVLLVTGSPGGSRIINIVLQVFLNTFEFGLDISEAVSAPRVYHQWLPDELQVEKGISPDTLRLLGQMGHQVVIRPDTGGANSIVVKDGTLSGAADPRDPGEAAGY